MIKEIPGVFLNDPEMSLGDLENIDILAKHVASEKWKEYVSTLNRHFMQMQNDEWPSAIVANNDCWYYWLKDWNENKLDLFASHLQSLDISEDHELFIFWMKEIALKTTWGVFYRNWANFLYEDEGCILVLPKHELSLVLSNGRAWVGKRIEPKT